MNIVVKVTSTVGSFSWEDGPGSLMNADNWRETHVVWEGCVSNGMNLSDAGIKQFLEEEGIGLDEDDEVEVVATY